MTTLNYSITEFNFVLISSFILLYSFYIQNYYIYKDLIKKEYFTNKDSILIQLKELNKNIKTNKYIFWNYQFIIFAITPLLFIFDIGGNLKNIWLGISIFLLIQFYLEYNSFYLNILIKKETENKTFENILESYETKQIYTLINLNKYQENNSEIIKKILLEKKDIIHMSIDDKRKIYSFINGKLSNKTNLHMKDGIIRIYGKNNSLLELDIETLSVAEVKESNTSYLQNFSEVLSFNRIFIIGLLEPFFMSILLLAIITIEI